MLGSNSQIKIPFLDSARRTWRPADPALGFQRTTAMAAMSAAKPAATRASSPVPTAPLPSSLSELRALASDLADFFARFDDLQSHLDDIDQRFRALESADSDDLAAGDAAVAGSGFIRSELELICEGMEGRRMRKYISTLLDSKDGKDAAALRAEVGAALRKATDMAKFAMSCVGRFYLQGSKAYERPGPMAAVRRSCILVLEAFLIAGGSAKVDDQCRSAAATEALAWKKRILQEGGMGVCSDMDARGLLLFMASFGIPSNFGKDDLFKLMNVSEIWKDSDILRASTVLQNEAEGIYLGREFEL